MTVQIEPRVVAAGSEHDKDPLAFLVASGLLEPRGATADRLRDILKPYLPQAEQLNQTAFLDARERVGRSLGPGETLAQLIVEMRKE